MKKEQLLFVWAVACLCVSTGLLVLALTQPFEINTYKIYEDYNEEQKEPILLYAENCTAVSNVTITPFNEWYFKCEVIE